MPWFISLNYCIGPLFLHSCIHPVLWANPGQPRRWASPDGWSTPITAALSCFGLLMSLLPWYIFSIFLLLILLLSALTSILTKSLLLSFCHDFHSYNLFYLKCFVSSFHCIQSQRQCCTKNLLMIASVTTFCLCLHGRKWIVCIYSQRNHGAVVKLIKVQHKPEMKNIHLQRKRYLKTNTFQKVQLILWRQRISTSSLCHTFQFHYC